MKEKEFHNALGYNIHVLSHFLQNIYNEKLGEHGLTHSQSRVIYFLATCGSQSQTELQQRLYIRPSSMNGIIDSLLKHGRITKESSVRDKRTKMIALTPSGQNLHASIIQIVRDIENQLTTGMSDDEKSTAVSLLKKMQDNIRPEELRRDRE
ncbi:MarR family transcriptional regulator [Halobacillus locisalis]|uniref:MarR family transcriptional regulator n=1 Tax=Halobacillus locisalis TaxID=220753 RepID=A0A838CXW8_9BACI|nr:MarR family transcriptional regulator [Halobacillus locisalis]MBA2176774.1 MarR family transcriptional regulator [Halobacillus locisalis]